MTHYYQETDWNVVDYQIYCLDEAVIDPQTNTVFMLRGPKPATLQKGEYFICIGAAQTFGRFCEKPFPILLQEKLGIPGINLGRGGAGPSFFSHNNEKLMDYINNAGFAIVQVMSGRSASNSLFESKGLGYYFRRSDGSGIGADEAFKEVLAHSNKKYIKQIVEETRTNWIESYQELLRQIKIPKILLWFSVRKPRYWEHYYNVSSLFNQFPQLINQKTVNRVKKYGDYYVECVSKRGMPQPLINRFTGQPTTVENNWGEIWTENWYYPSPEMHIEAAIALEAVIKKLQRQE
ncbi:hypothetical protein PCC7424_4253 [Gloeothece citriformis PCC 7424]|uniref:DUF6473 domain-containing protein n=1 Tax=Gloeothece citriformis (strain PCC 7424) TaxID=65393 RepID=B7K6S4_GLOC7|nr:DUF6473 family protein [Gloeothece citriformis]ACK72623.1 hypothetical protein PCC7424_4253 [Gloeothece citriformis PCC 7424]